MASSQAMSLAVPLRPDHASGDQVPDSHGPPPTVAASRAIWRQGGFSAAVRTLPEETAVALTYNRATYAVMMTSPGDLEDFAVGFSLTERVIDSPKEIEELEIVSTSSGIEARMWITEDRASKLQERQRRLAGPTGCGLCGLDSLSQAVRVPPTVTSDPRFTPAEIMQAVASLRHAQPLGAMTRAMHGAGFWAGDGCLIVREDVGRHNALDKLAGALARRTRSERPGLVVMTSRVSVELVQKAATMNVAVLAAVSAPTALALRVAEAAEVTLIGVARDDGFEVFTHPGRVGAPGSGQVLLGQERDLSNSTATPRQA